MHKKGSIFITLGLLLLAAALCLTAYNIWDGKRADAAAQEAVASLRAVIAGEVATQPEEDASQPPTEAPTESTEGTEAPTIPDPDRPMPTVTINGYRYIGTLDVPDFELSLPVMEEWDYDRLKVSPCRFTGSVYRDDLVICAHNYPQHFQKLKYAPMDTQVIFTDADDVAHYYRVISIDTVGPDDMQGLITGEWDLTLFTCNTNGQTRCAIRCERIV